MYVSAKCCLRTRELKNCEFSIDYRILNELFYFPKLNTSMQIKTFVAFKVYASIDLTLFILHWKKLWLMLELQINFCSITGFTISTYRGYAIPIYQLQSLNIPPNHSTSTYMLWNWILQQTTKDFKFVKFQSLERH